MERRATGVIVAFSLVAGVLGCLTSASASPRSRDAELRHGTFRIVSAVPDLAESWQTGRHRAAMPARTVAVLADGVWYYHHAGVFHRPVRDGYVVCNPPRGVLIRRLPRTRARIVIGSRAYYFHRGCYFRHVRNGYRVTASWIGKVR